MYEAKPTLKAKTIREGNPVCEVKSERSSESKCKVNSQPRIEVLKREANTLLRIKTLKTQGQN